MYEQNSTKNILLINPRWGQEAFFPLELATICAYLQNNAYRTTSCDMDFDNIFDNLGQSITKTYDAVIISVLYHQLPTVKSICKRLSILNNSIPVIITGNYTTLFPKEALRDTEANYAILGDAEKTSLNLLNHIFYEMYFPEHVAYFSADGTFTQNGPAFFDHNLDDLPFADRKLFPVERYGYAYRSDHYPYAAMKTSRSCNQNCHFCNIPAYCKDSGFVARSAKSIVEEMKMLQQFYGVKSIHFEDDAFFSNLEHVSNLCDEILRQNLDIPWELVNGVRPKEIDLKMLSNLSEAGCKHICLGIESLSEQKSNSYYSHTISEIKKITKQARKNKIGTTGYFIVGLPNTSYEENEYTVLNSKTLGLNMVHFSVYNELPGSIFSETRQSSKISEEQAAKLASIGYRKFYISPLQVGKMLMDFGKAPKLIQTVLYKTVARFTS